MLVIIIHALPLHHPSGLSIMFSLDFKHSTVSLEIDDSLLGCPDLPLQATT